MSPHATVIGTVFVDCKGFARNTYRPDGRNIGRIEFMHGGVGRNVAENLARMGVRTSFVSSVERSALGREVIQRLQALHIDTSNVYEAAAQGMGMWLAILDENGNLAGSISQMPDLAHLENIVAENGESFVKQSSHIILELDLNAAITRNILQLAEQYNKPVYGIPGNLEVIMSHPEFLDGLSCFICNNFEAERIIGPSFSGGDLRQMEEDLIRFVDGKSLSSMVVTLGEHGSVYYDSVSKQSGHQPAFPVHLVDSSGAGDAFFSGTVMGLIHNIPLRESVVYGTRVAGWTIESQESTCPDLRRRMGQDALFQPLLSGRTS